MTNTDAYKMFKSVYPERYVNGFAQAIDTTHSLITADFPDGRFYFIVTPSSVSSSYDNREQAIEQEGLIL